MNFKSFLPLLLTLSVAFGAKGQGKDLGKAPRSDLKKTLENIDSKLLGGYRLGQDLIDSLAKGGYNTQFKGNQDPARVFFQPHNAFASENQPMLIMGQPNTTNQLALFMNPFMAVGDSTYNLDDIQSFAFDQTLTPEKGITTRLTLNRFPDNDSCIVAMRTIKQDAKTPNLFSPKLESTPQECPQVYDTSLASCTIDKGILESLNQEGYKINYVYPKQNEKLNDLAQGRIEAGFDSDKTCNYMLTATQETNNTTLQIFFEANKKDAAVHLGTKNIVGAVKTCTENDFVESKQVFGSKGKMKHTLQQEPITIDNPFKFLTTTY